MASVADRVDGWYTISGQRYRSVTSVTKAIPKPELEAWKLRVAVAAGATDAPAKEAARAARRGTSIHDFTQDWALGRPRTAEPTSEQLGYLAGFERWVDEHKPKPLFSERTVWSNSMMYAGTLDLVVDIGGRVGVLDYKTVTNPDSIKKYPPYPENWVQTEAYRRAHHEMTGEWLKHKFILRLGPDGTYSMSSRYADSQGEDESSTAWMVFFHALRLLNEVEALKGMNEELKGA